MNFVEVTVAFVTAIVAVYGAVLATYNLFVERANRVPRLTVSLHLGTKHPDGPEWVVPQMFVRVGNAGRAVVHLAMWGICFDERSDVPFGSIPTSHAGEATVPVELAAGKGFVFNYPLSGLTTWIERQGKQPSSCRAYALDQLGNRYASANVDVQLAEWLAMIPENK
jgi:hypothetical protein